MLCFQRNWFRADLCEMARSCSKLQQVDKLCKYAENSTIKVFYWGWLRVSSKSNQPAAARRHALPVARRRHALPGQGGGKNPRPAEYRVTRG